MKEDDSFTAKVVEIFGPLADLRAAGHRINIRDWELVEAAAAARDAAVLGNRSLAVVAVAVASGIPPTSASARSQLEAAAERAGWGGVERYLLALQRVVDRYVAEKKALLAAPVEAPEGSAPYGKWAFAAQRDDVPPEDDTPEESATLNALLGHVVDNQPMDSTDAQRIRGDLSAGRYKKVLHPPPSRWLFRGISLPLEGVSRLLRRDVEDVGERGEEIIDKPLRAQRRGADSRQDSTSWTTSLATAVKFSKFAMTMSTAKKGTYAVILVASTADNPNAFLTGHDGFYRLRDLANFSKEEEIIGLGPIVVHKVYWQSIQPDESFNMDVAEDSLSESTLRRYIKEVIASPASDSSSTAFR